MLRVLSVAVFLVLELMLVARADLPEGATARFGTTELRNRQGVNGVAFSNDGSQLVSVGWGDSIRFWDLSTGRQVKRIVTTEMFAVAFSPDGTHMAAVGNGRVQLFDLENDEAVVDTEEQPGRIYGIAFTSDGLTFATGGSSEAVHLWDATTGDELLKLPTAGGSDAHPVAFSPDGHLLASGDKEGVLHVWNLHVGSKTTEHKTSSTRGFVSIAFTKDGKHLITSGTYHDRAARMMRCDILSYPIENGVLRDEPSGWKAEGEDFTGECSLALSHDGRTLVSAHREKIILWDVETRTPKRLIPRKPDKSGVRTHSVAISPDGSLVASKGRHHKVYLWDATTGKELFPQPNTHHGGPLTIDTSLDDRLVVTGGEGGAIHLWDAETGEHIRQLAQSGGWVRHLEFFPDGKRILAVGEFHNTESRRFEGVALTIDTSGQELERVQLPDRGMHAALTPDGNKLTIAQGLSHNFGGRANPPSITVWNLDSDDDPLEFPSGSGELKQLAFDETGRTIVASFTGGVVRKWDAATGKELGGFDLKAERLLGADAAFSPDQKTLILGGLKSSRKPSEQRGRLRAVNMETSESIWHKELLEHWPAIVEFSRDGKRFALHLRAMWKSDAKNRIFVGRVVDGEQLAMFEFDDGYVRSLAFARDARHLYSGMDRGDLILWNLPGGGD